MAVEEFHWIGLKNCGKDNGTPADFGNGAYGAYLIDPNGNNVEAIYRGS